jgi:hypothetical protein
VSFFPSSVGFMGLEVCSIVVSSRDVFQDRRHDDGK